MKNIHTSADMIRTIARAMIGGDVSLLERCEQLNEDWLQTKEERDAMRELIGAAFTMIEMSA